MKVLYIADDGKEFEDEDECMEYEKIQEAEKLGALSEIHALDNNFKELKVSNSPRDYDMETMLKHVMYVKFDSIKAAEYFDDQLEYYGYDRISMYNDNLKIGVYAYDDGKDVWESVTEMLEYYQGIMDNFAEKKQVRECILGKCRECCDCGLCLVRL